MKSRIDRYGRAKPIGTRHVFEGRTRHRGQERPLSFNMQVRPQVAEPRKVQPRGTESRPIYGEYAALVRAAKHPLNCIPDNDPHGAWQIVVEGEQLQRGNNVAAMVAWTKYANDKLNDTYHVTRVA